MSGSRTVLAVGAHPDDEALGPGGTLARHAAGGDEVHAVFVTEGVTAQYDDPEMVERRRAAARRAADVLGLASVAFHDLPDMGLAETAPVEVNAVVEEAVAEHDPEVVYTHASADLNADHRAVHEATLVATRPGSGVERVLAYEVGATTAWGEGTFEPTVYVDVTDHLATKIAAFEAYESEVEPFPHPRSPAAVRARARTRGSEAGVEAAEAFALVREYR